jgi:hypothetical protein
VHRDLPERTTNRVDALGVPGRRPKAAAEVLEDEQRPVPILEAEHLRVPRAPEMLVHVMLAPKTRHHRISSRLLDENRPTVRENSEPAERWRVSAADCSRCGHWTPEEPLHAPTGIRRDRGRRHFEPPTRGSGLKLPPSVRPPCSKAAQSCGLKNPATSFAVDDTWVRVTPSWTGLSCTRGRRPPPSCPTLLSPHDHRWPELSSA